MSQDIAPQTATLEDFAAAEGAELERRLKYVASAWKDDLGPVERAEWVFDLIDRGSTQKEIAQAINCSDRLISYYYKLNWLPEDNLEQIEDGTARPAAFINKARKLYDIWIATGSPDNKKPHIVVSVPMKYGVKELLEQSEDLDCPEEISIDYSFNDAPAPEPKTMMDCFFSTPTNCGGFQPALHFTKKLNPEKIFDTAFQAYRDWIGMDAQSMPKAPLVSSKGEQLIAEIADLHCPFQHEPTVKAFINHFKGRGAICVVGGDMADMAAFSSFAKYTKPYSPADEFRSTQAIANLLSETFREVHIMAGNHDDRFIKYLVRCGAPPEILEYFNLLAPGFTNPLSLITKHLPNVHIVEPIVRPDMHAKFAFLKQIGDLIVGHAEVYSRIPGRAAGNFVHWLKAFAEPKGIVKPFKVAANGHTHQQAQYPGDYGVWTIETGCACMESDYVGKAEIKTPRPWARGFYEFTQVDGVTDMNRSRFYSTTDFK